MRNDKEFVAQHFDRVADDYENLAKSSGWRGDQCCERFLSEVKFPEGKVLDLGCADGYSSTPLFHAGKYEVHGIDLSPRCIEKARSKHPFATAITHDLDNPFPFADGIFGAVISYGVLEFVNDLPSVISEVKRVLRPGGFFSFTVNELIPGDDVQSGKVFEIVKGRYGHHRHSNEEIKGMLEPLKFRLLHTHSFKAYKTDKLPKLVTYRFFIAQI